VHQCHFLKWLALVTESGCDVWTTLHDPAQHSALQHFSWMVSWLISFMELLKAEDKPTFTENLHSKYSLDRTVFDNKSDYDLLILWCFELC